MASALTHLKCDVYMACQLSLKGGLSKEFTSHGFSGENVLPICVHLQSQAMAVRRLWLHTEGGLSAELSLPNNKYPMH